MSNLDRIVELCKGSVTVEVNDHTTTYQTIGEYFAGWGDEASKALDRCVEAGRAVVVTAYPDTPVGSYQIIDSTTDRALARMLALLKDNQKEQGK